MTMRKKPLIIEFTGPPNSGKTTIIKFLHQFLQAQGYDVEIKQEDAELVPKCIPKKTWARNVWITNGQLQSLIEAKFSTADVVLCDRGFYDSIFWAKFLNVQNICSNEDSISLLNILNEMDKQFELRPDYLFVVDVSTKVSLERRYAQSGNEPITCSTDDFINLYKVELEKFCKEVTTPMYYLDTSLLSKKEMQKAALDYLSSI